ncbi:hypothetical protein PHISP_00182 [Aspergillus sp. HF37]|nr:hypothetical protein PHISP_00182 [Aspergillus sp. HF37]
MAVSRGTRSKEPAPPKEDPSTAENAKRSQKRKRDLDVSAAEPSKSAPAKKPKKEKNARASPSEPAASEEVQKRPKSPDESDLQSPVESRDKAISPSVNGDMNVKKSKSAKRKTRTSNSASEAVDNTDMTESVRRKHDLDEKDSGKSRTKSKTHEEAGEPSPKKGKHSGVLSKFERTAKVKESVKATEGDAGNAQDSKSEMEAAEPVVAHGLEPLPQPEAGPEQVEKPKYSSLPEWLANPLRASAEEKTKFSDLDVDSDVLRILETNGYKQAFAVQSTVLPLLLQGPKHHPGDVCISAATGSGKTLSYVLPLVKSLEPLSVPRLRGLIVVPTRELVKQARETCELFAGGSGLRIGSAIGNVAIKEEQQSLIRTDPLFSPGIFDHQRRGELEVDHWTNFNLQQYVSENEHHNEFLHDYVEKRDPNVDILICTPGRLVDHIRHTRGFTLGHMQWLVIDEADRLLNESFQEWVDVVMSSLDARTSPDTLGFSGKFLSGMGLPMQPPEPKKVILSATMTRDISKLNTLRLTNPKMVIVSSEDNALSGDTADDRFTLPSTLKEHSISVGDGAEKPLYLLRLLLSHIKLAAQESDQASGSDDTSSDDSSSDSSSESSASEDSSDESSDESSESDSTSSDEDISEVEDSEEDASGPPARNTVLIFTKSSEAASRLSRLLSILHPRLGSRVGTIIKSNKSSASRRTLTAYRRGKISVIVATDRASRGLDLRSLNHVVNYDVPPSITSYVHRVGRTARAGENGSAWTLVAHREGRWFASEIAKDAGGKITRSAKLEKVNVKLDGMDEAKSKYGSALEMLEAEVKTDGKAKE